MTDLTITRRAALLGVSVLAITPRISLASISVPRPALFTNELWQRPPCWNGQPVGDLLRAEFLRQMHDKLIPAERTEATIRRTLWPRYVFELAYDGIRPDMREAIETDLCHAIVSEIVCDIEQRQAYRLVALDGWAKIDVDTFQPYLEFYADWNVMKRGTYRLPS
jgi:hypothetical protein